MDRHSGFRLWLSDDQCYRIRFKGLGVLLVNFQLHIARGLVESIRGADGQRNGLCSIVHLQAHLWRYQFKQATGFASNLNRVEACANLLAAGHEVPAYLAGHPGLNSLWREHDDGNEEFLRRHAAVKIRLGPTLYFEAGEVPGDGDFQATTQSEISQFCAHVRCISGSSMPYPHAPVQVSGIPAGSIDLHIVAQFVSKQVTVVSRVNNRLDP